MRRVEGRGRVLMGRGWEREFVVEWVRGKERADIQRVVR